MSKREAKHDDDSGKDDSDEDISDSGSEADEDSSEEDMSESEDDRKGNPKAAGAKAFDGVKAGGSQRSLTNQPFDEAVDLSESEGSILSEDPNSPKKPAGAGRALKNQPFDEALELSESVQEVESPQKTTMDKPASVSMEAGAKSSLPNVTSTLVGNETKNKPFDEEVDLSDSGDSIDTNGQPSPKARQDSKESRQPPQQIEAKKTTAETPTPALKPAVAAPEKRPEPVRKPAQESASSSDESESDDDDDEEDDDDEGDESQSTSHVASAAAPHTGNTDTTASSGSSNHAAMMANAGGYKESDYAHLKVSHEIRELFQYIGRFKAQEIELETRLKCFIPEFIPAVGDMDAFLKVPRPDGQPDQLGLKMLDEPSLTQSDATVLDLQLRSTSKKKHGDIVVRSIENAEKSPREIDRWIKSIADLHRTKPPPQVHYTKTMPDIESLMQVWPEEFEELLGKTTLPGADLDMGLEQYVRVICALLDIPVHKNVYESLHVLFTLYLEFSSNQHFMPLL
ncbi:Intraflagellar transport complex B protein 46 C terminal [Phytophthora infestans]|uniref:Intraflagellar transport complex B protein 46 C terminal n=1 Tax=Phytophthora infestans TaxID=4787 RepID=A0A8S9VHW7_PHYIN|nr:Intraflagellar transport complex B protein 46 C terminal [Phytophthora infestans]